MRLSLQEQNIIHLQQNHDKIRYSSLHKAVKQYKNLSEQLSLKLFQFVSKKKKQTNILINNKYLSKEKQNRESGIFISRKVRRQALGLQQADIENHWNKILGKFGQLVKRKNQSMHKKRNFQVSEHVKGKFNIKGFAARIDHTLGKRKTGINQITKMINTQLIKH